MERQVAAPVEQRHRHRLDQARTLIQAGDAPNALKCLVEVLADLQGREGVANALSRVVEGLQSGGQTPGVQDLAMLFAQVSLQVEQTAGHGLDAGTSGMDVDAAPGPSHHQQQQQQQQQQAFGQQHGAHHAGPAILEETGRSIAAEHAMEDGSSFQCQRCGGIVSRNREQQHVLWCQP